MLTYEKILKNEKIKTYIKKADESLNVMGFTAHSFAHVTKVANTARYILKTMGFSEHLCELAAIAGFMHDIGNVINRENHAQNGALMAFKLLEDMGAEPEDIATIVTAIGNHDEGAANSLTPVAAALILADKSDACYTRVRNTDVAKFDIHDRVNYSVRESEITINDEHTQMTLSLIIDTELSAVFDYFEIFLGRMVLCRKAAEMLNLKFHLEINGQKLI